MALNLIGAGLGRTGTLSLKLALEQLGIGPCCHMAELLDPSRGAAWVHAADGHPDWNSIFEGFAATVDYPGCTFWRELIQFYPSAKVLAFRPQSAGLVRLNATDYFFRAAKQAVCEI